MPKLTKRTVDAIEPQATEFFIWDESIPGFGLRVMPSGRKSFVVQYRAGRRPRRMSLGPSTVLTCDQARTRAITIIAAVKNGEDPAADRAAKRNAATVSDLAERFDIGGDPREAMDCSLVGFDEGRADLVAVADLSADNVFGAAQQRFGGRHSLLRQRQKVGEYRCFNHWRGPVMRHCNIPIFCTCEGLGIFE